MRIENWAVVFPPSISPYTPPELLKQSLQGEVFGHPKCNDGRRITTSSIVGKNNRNEILTYSGGTYELGQIDPAYEAQFPGAKNKLLSSLPLLECTCLCHQGGYDGGGVCKQPCDKCDDLVSGCTAE